MATVRCPRVDNRLLSHLRAQADRYDRVARTLDPDGDGRFPRTMADGYLAKAERYAGVDARLAGDDPAAPLYANTMRKLSFALE